MPSLLYLGKEPSKCRLHLLERETTDSRRNPHEVPAWTQSVVARTHNVAKLAAETVPLHGSTRFTPNGVCHVGLAH